MGIKGITNSQACSSCSAVGTSWSKHTDLCSDKVVVRLLAGKLQLLLTHIHSSTVMLPLSDNLLRSAPWMQWCDHAHGTSTSFCCYSCEHIPPGRVISISLLLQMGTQPGSTAHLLWSHPVLSSMQQQTQSSAQLTIIHLSAVAMSGNRHNIAVLAEAPDGALVLQLLSGSLNARPEELSTDLLTTGEATANKQAGKWRCCCSRQCEVLFWREGGSVYRWTRQAGLYRRPGYKQTLSACCVPD